ncbi:TPA: HAD family hydrolase [Staphylococcus aureus]
MKFDNYIFDFDGTLADTKKCGEVATQSAFKACGLTEPSSKEITHYMGIPIEESFLKLADRPLDEAALAKLIDTFRHTYQSIEKDYIYEFAGITEAITSLYNQGKKLFVVSSKKSDVLERNLSAQVSAYKPNPEGIHTIVQRYNLNSQQTVYIGDSTFDVEMAQRAGMQSAAVTWGAHDARSLLHSNPDFIINDPSEINTVL